MAYRPPILEHTALNKSGLKWEDKKKESKPEPAPCVPNKTKLELYTMACDQYYCLNLKNISKDGAEFCF